MAPMKDLLESGQLHFRRGRFHLMDELGRQQTIKENDQRVGGSGARFGVEYFMEHAPILALQVQTVRVDAVGADSAGGPGAEEREHCRDHVGKARARVEKNALSHPGPAHNQGAPRLQHAHASVAAAAVMGPGPKAHHQVRRVGRIKEGRDPFER